MGGSLPAALGHPLYQPSKRWNASFTATSMSTSRSRSCSTSHTFLTMAGTLNLSRRRKADPLPRPPVVKTLKFTLICPGAPGLDDLLSAGRRALDSPPFGSPLAHLLKSAHSKISRPWTPEKSFLCSSLPNRSKTSTVTRKCRA